MPSATDLVHAVHESIYNPEWAGSTTDKLLPELESAVRVLMRRVRESESEKRVVAGEQIVLMRRLDGLDDAISKATGVAMLADVHQDIRRCAEQVRSTAERMLGIRDREVDRVREGK